MDSEIYDKPVTEFTHSVKAEKGLRDEAARLVREDGLSENDALLAAAMTMDGAGEGETVESMQTCRNLFKEAVPGLTTDDIPFARNDEFARSQSKRHKQAERGVDLASIWLTLSRIPEGGLEVANKIAETVDSDGKTLKRFQKIIFVLAVKERWSDAEVVKFLKKLIGEEK
ncbi:MAG: hypothetical protein UW41_C0036G0007 [Candidatus Collierbacteria bacterium GW2011_GWC2_44_18]|uniref:Uncharacterized protein n=2 Tax=Microgenomates group TaxID=1794810 RepID=A0A0G1J3Y7_9BACT|nr:MAG: hypothetical protein UW41_C0036G0007 [Candidatus Collierbacteria bacterium GW2011_GWC2_44_18]KKT66346.1 MAG: hypothetical protein UW60_C0025G0006 [Candidatus Woesebacteria bacterium GW2011_GWA2_44_33]